MPGDGIHRDPAAKAIGLWLRSSGLVRGSGGSVVLLGRRLGLDGGRSRVGKGFGRSLFLK